MLREFSSKILNGEVSLGKPMFERASNRELWGNVPPELTENIIKYAEEYLNYKWPCLLTTDFLQFERTGNRVAWETPVFKRRNILVHLILAECFEYKGRFIDDITNGIVLTCEETYWGLSAHRYGGSTGIQQNYDPYLDIFSSDVGAILSMAIYLLEEKLDKTVIERVKAEIKFRMLDAFLKHNDYWWQAVPRFEGEKRFVNNWNPWICENLVTSYILASPDEEYMRKGIAKVMEIIDYFVDAIPEDGGCDEGISYWGSAAGSLFVALEQLYISSGGEIDFFGEEKIKNAGDFFAKMFICESYVVNFNDCAHRYGGGSGWIQFTFGKRTNNPVLCNIGKIYWKKNGGKIYVNHSFRSSGIFAFLSQGEIAEYDTNVELPDYSYLESLQMLTAWQDRKESTGLFLATKGGHNDESHNHNDVGTLTIYANGTPLLADPGSTTYTKDHFNENRYRIWNHQTSWHNLPEINGYMQCQGKDFKAKNPKFKNGDVITFDVDLEAAWQSKCSIKAYHRNIAFDKINGTITVTDKFSFIKEENTVTENLILPSSPEMNGKSLFVKTENGTKCKIEWNLDTDVLAQYKDVSNDFTCSKNWKNGLWRVRLTFDCNQKAEFSYTVKIVE